MGARGRELEIRSRQHAEENLQDFTKIALRGLRERLSTPQLRGCSSVVERHLAKVDVVSSNLITRSIFKTC